MNNDELSSRVISVVDVGADQTGGGGLSCIKIDYSIRERRRVLQPTIKIGYVSAMDRVSALFDSDWLRTSFGLNLGFFLT